MGVRRPGQDFIVQMGSSLLQVLLRVLQDQGKISKNRRAHHCSKYRQAGQLTVSNQVIASIATEYNNTITGCRIGVFLSIHGCYKIRARFQRTDGLITAPSMVRQASQLTVSNQIIASITTECNNTITGCIIGVFVSIHGCYKIRARFNSTDGSKNRSSLLQVLLGRHTSITTECNNTITGSRIGVFVSIHGCFKIRARFQNNNTITGCRIGVFLSIRTDGLITAPSMVRQASQLTVSNQIIARITTECNYTITRCVIRVFVSIHGCH
jgi:ABC-type Co2+ transport system permease subunit